jgi:hypothetical protein
MYARAIELLEQGTDTLERSRVLDQFGEGLPTAATDLRRLPDRLNNFLKDRHRFWGRQKRGSGHSPMSLDLDLGEPRFARTASGGEPPETIVDRAWAKALEPIGIFTATEVKQTLAALDKIAERAEPDHQYAARPRALWRVELVPAVGASRRPPGRAW